MSYTNAQLSNLRERIEIEMDKIAAAYLSDNPEADSMAASFRARTEALTERIGQDLVTELVYMPAADLPPFIGRNLM